MRFLIRDDDTCALTSPADISRCYENIWDRIPVGLAVTPFRIPGPLKPFSGHPFDTGQPVPLEKNPEMVSFLKEMKNKNKIDVLLHGFDHSTPGGLPEFFGGQDLSRKAKSGSPLP